MSTKSLVSAGRLPMTILLGWLLTLGLASGMTLLPLTTGTARAGQSNAAAEEFIQQTGDKVINALRDGTATGSNAETWFRDMLMKTLDIKTMGRFTLGRYWRSASPTQRDEFLDAFRDSLVKVYTRRLQEYSGENFKILGSRPEGNDDVLVTTRITSQQGQPIDADWRLRKQSDGSFRVIDFVVGNVSLLASQRSEYASLIQRNGGSIEALIEAIRSKSDALPTGN